MPGEGEIYEAGQLELREAAIWYEDQSEGLGKEFTAAVDVALRLITRTPTVWPKVWREVRRYPLKRFPFAILYREVGTGLEVLAVAHHARKPGYWK